MKFLQVLLLSILIALSGACSNVPLPIVATEKKVTLAKPVGLTADVPVKESHTEDAPQLARQIPLHATSEVSKKVTTVSLETVDAIELSLQPDPTTEQKKSVSSIDRLQHGIQLLKNGKVALAKKEFEQVLQLQPNNKTALYMLRQIRLTPQQYFAKRSFMSRYQAQTGDDFSTIANQFLGNSLDFHSLLKLNKRQNINDIKMGDIVLVPLTQSVTIKKKSPAKATKIKTAALSKPRQTAAQIKLANTQIKAERFYLSGVKALQKGREYDAFKAFEKTLILQPDNDMAAKQLLKLKPTVTQYLHDKAMVLYKNQKIKAAIGNWDRLLMIDSEHELARVYRGRAIELQDRLNKLPKNL